jgi:F-type H+-transporting ATPase subunit b
MQLELIPALAVMLFVPFAVTFFALRFILWQPLLAYLEAREHAIDGTKHEALRLTHEAAARTTELEKKLLSAREDIAAERSAARKRVADKHAVIVGDARAEADRQLADAVVQIERARAQAALEVRPMAHDLAREIAAGVLGRQVV